MLTTRENIKKEIKRLEDKNVFLAKEAKELYAQKIWARSGNCSIEIMQNEKRIKQIKRIA